MPNISSLEENVKNLSNDDLYKKLTEHNVSVGPIVASTRGVYEKKLIRLMGGDVPDSPYSGTVDEEEYTEHISNGDGYATEKHTRYSSTKQSSSPTLRSRTAAAASSAKTWDRNLEDSLSFDHDRHTPSPRPSLRTVTSSTTTTTSTKYISPSGNIRETRTLRETYTPLSKSGEAPDEGKAQLTRFLVKCLFILILLLVLYVTYQSLYSESPFEGLEKYAKQALNSANKEIKKGAKDGSKEA